jgi:type IV pilus biogenesis protein PilP
MSNGKSRLIVFLLMAAAIAAVLTQLWLQPKVDNLLHIQESLESRLGDSSRRLGRLTVRPDEGARTNVSGVRQATTQELVEINRLARLFKVEIASFESGKTEVQAQMLGTYANVRGFLTAVLNSIPFAQIKKLSLVRDTKDAERLYSQVSVELILSFRPLKFNRPLIEDSLVDAFLAQKKAVRSATSIGPSVAAVPTRKSLASRARAVRNNPPVPSEQLASAVPQEMPQKEIAVSAAVIPNPILVGVFERQGKILALLNVGGRIVAASSGDTLDGGWQLVSITSSSLKLVNSSVNQTQEIDLVGFRRVVSSGSL